MSGNKAKDEISAFRFKYISNNVSSNVALLTLSGNQQPFVELIDMLMQSKDLIDPMAIIMIKRLRLYMFLSILHLIVRQQIEMDLH